MKTKNPGRTLTLFAAMALISACGGGGGGSVTLPLGPGPPDIPPVTTDVPVGGWWMGTTMLTTGQQEKLELLALVAEDGRAYFLQQDGVMFWGTLQSSRDRVTSTLVGAGLLGTPLWDGSASGTGTVSGTIWERSTIVGTQDFTTTAGGRTVSSLALTYQSMYDDNSSLATIAGNYADALGLSGGVLNIASNGTLFLQDPASGCVINGQVSIINAAYNAYGIRFSYSSCTGLDSALNGVTFTGLAGYDAGAGQAIALVQGSVGGIPFANAFVFERV
jgi:hypothetical protein